jgi:arylsulfatase A-like enzyme
MKTDKVNRRGFLRLMMSTSAAVAFTGSASVANAIRSKTVSSETAADKLSPPRKRPNVLLIISDDQGYGDFGFMENPIVRTPNLDELASAGALLRNYSTGAACSPARSMLYTGRNHLLTGVWGVPIRQNLRTDETMMPAFFKAGGYETFYIGKDDCSAQVHTLPWFAGWDDALAGGGYQHKDPVLRRKPDGDMPLQWKNDKYEGWTSEIWTDEAVNFIKEKKDKPWLLTMAYIIPHLPWEPVDERYAPYYREKGCSDNIAACFSHIEQMDACIGRLLNALAQTGQDRDTIIIFVSDNGQTGPSAQTVDKDGHIDMPDWNIRNVAGLRGCKTLVWENGVRVPLIVRYPGVIPAGGRNQFAAAEDILPTLLDYAGIDDDIVSHKPFCGVSLRRALDDKDTVVEHPEIFRMTIWGEGMVKAPRGFVPDPPSLRLEDHHVSLCGPKYKLHVRPGGRVELYDKVNDIQETRDISKKQPKVTARMLAECRRRWDYAINEGGAFRMAPILIGDPSTWKYPDGTYWGYAGKVQDVSGEMYVTNVLQGFALAGDSAAYLLDVAKQGKYAIKLTGKELTNAAPLSVTAAGQTITQQKATDNTIEFGVLNLPKGKIPLTITAGETEKKTKAVAVERILFSLVE